MRDLEMRPITPDEVREFIRAVERGFGTQPSDEEVELYVPFSEPERTLAVYDVGEIVATAGAITFELTVPGGRLVPAAGVTVVGVRPTHRRQGLLRRMMARQLDDVAARGEPVAALTASESLIYGRFGYGLATSNAHVSIDTVHAAFRPDVPVAGGRLRLVDVDTARKVCPEVFDRMRRQQPGEVSRQPAYWDAVVRDPTQWREGWSGAFWVVHEDDTGEADGYAVYRYKDAWPDGLPAKEVQVSGLAATSWTAEAALWQYLLDLDLVARVVCDVRPVEDPLRWSLADPRRLRTTAVTDHLWVRLVDVAAALSARSYRGGARRLVFEVRDGFRPQSGGRYAVEVDGDGAGQCAPAADAADLALDVDALGAAYLGGVRFTTLAAAGRVQELSAGALVAADAMFATDRVPFCRTGF